MKILFHKFDALEIWRFLTNIHAPKLEKILQKRI